MIVVPVVVVYVGDNVVVIFCGVVKSFTLYVYGFIVGVVVLASVVGMYTRDDVFGIIVDDVVVVLVSGSFTYLILCEYDPVVVVGVVFVA